MYKVSKDEASADKKKGSGRTILYARVSTLEQTLAHQQAQAEAAGFHIDDVVADHGVSGVSTTLADRPEGRRLFDTFAIITTDTNELVAEIRRPHAPDPRTHQLHSLAERRA